MWFFKRIWIICFILLLSNPGFTQFVAGEINITGNVKTHQYLIKREIVIHEGDSLSASEINEVNDLSVSNILKTNLFHTVTVNATIRKDTIDFNFIVKERWYWWIWPWIERPDRNFNDWWQHKDLLRVSAGLHFQHENMRGRGEKLNLKAWGGYKTNLEASYEWPYINRKKTIGAGIFAAFSSGREVDFTTRENKQVFWHSSKDVFTSQFYTAYLKFRPGIRYSHFFTLSYRHYRYSDSLTVMEPRLLSGLTNPGFLSLSYLIKADYRDNRYYPLKGFYSEAETGFLKDINSSYNQQSVRLSIRGYLPLAANLIAASEFTSRFTAPGRKPYFLQNALGYDREFIRGYEYLVIEAPHYWLFKSQLRYAVLPYKSFRIPCINSSKFNPVPLSIFLGPHFDCGQAFPALNKEINSLQNEILSGYGLGIDFVTYYEKVLRLEYTFISAGGSGFFIHFMAMI